MEDELLEALQDSLNAMGRALLRDVAEVLNIPSQELIQKIYSQNQATVKHLHRETIEQPLCKLLVQHYAGAFYCGRPTKDGICIYHHTPNINIEKAIPLKAIKGFPEYYVTPQGYVIDKEGLAVGTMKHDIFYKF